MRNDAKTAADCLQLSGSIALVPNRLDWQPDLLSEEYTFAKVKQISSANIGLQAAQVERKDAEKQSPVYS